MANTTFKGTVRAESGLKVSTQTAGTGAYTDYFTVSSAGVLSVTGRSTLTGNTIATTAGTGITSGSGTIYASSAIKSGGMYHTKILMDLTGLASSGSADIIGKDSTANCHIGQITAAVSGTLLGGQITCLEVPAGGDPDIDLWYADEATGTEDAAISGLSNQVQVTNGGDHTLGGVDAFLAGVVPAADKYLYLVSGAATNADYTAGRLLIEMWGYSA